MITRTKTGKFKHTIISLGIFKVSIMTMGIKRVSIRFNIEWGKW